MEKLYDKFSRRPWNETMKLIHFCTDKPRVTLTATLTATSDSPITYCLEKIKRTLDVCLEEWNPTHESPLYAARTLSTVLNKLESLTREKYLESYVSRSGTAFYVATDTFYIEIHLEDDGAVKDVMLAHPAKSFLTCEYLLQHLRMQNYDAFGKFLEQLLNLYQIPGDSCTKFKGHIALFILEQDLCSLSMLYRLQEMDRVTEILCGEIGYVRPRTEGIPLSIEFYLTPYQILEEQLTPGLELSGMKVFLTMGLADEIHTLVLSPLIERSVSGADATPFLPLSEATTIDLQACFFLVFQQPFPMSLSHLQELQKITGIPVAGLTQAPLDELIVQLALSETCKDDPTMSNYFYVSLPDIPKERLFINISPEKSGAMVNSIPFVYWMCVPEIIEILRSQAAYNTLVSSCTSADTTCEDSSDLLYLEVSSQKSSCITVTFQHPLSDNLACVAIDVLSSREVRCTLHTVSNDVDLNCSNDYLSEVIIRCMSIPVFMRAIFKRAAQQKAAETIQITEETSEQNPNENEAAPSSMPNSGDDSGSISPEGSSPETSRQIGENASVEPSSAGIEGASVGPTGGKISDELFLRNLELADEETTPLVTSPLSRMEDYCIDDLFSPQSME